MVLQYMTSWCAAGGSRIPVRLCNNQSNMEDCPVRAGPQLRGAQGCCHCFPAAASTAASLARAVRGRRGVTTGTRWPLHRCVAFIVVGHQDARCVGSRAASCRLQRMAREPSGVCRGKHMLVCWEPIFKGSVPKAIPMNAHSRGHGSRAFTLCRLWTEMLAATCEEWRSRLLGPPWMCQCLPEVGTPG